MKLSDITCMFVDNGLFVDMAALLSQTYGKVYYTYPSPSSFPKLNKSMIGEGLGEIEIIDHYDRIDPDEIDLWVFPDCYYGPTQVRLEAEGRNVWGSRMGEDIELEREWAKKLFHKLGMPGNEEGKDYEVIQGFSNLREYLKKHKNIWVKMSRWRGSFETFCSTHYDEIEPKLDEIEYKLGKFKDTKKARFVCEKDLPDRRELGVDGYNIDGKFPSKMLAGCEIKGESYIGIFKDYADFPEALTRFDRLMSPTLKRCNYRGFWSSEIRVGENLDDPRIIDPCTRAGSPPSELYQVFYTNLPEIIWEGAQGRLIDPEPIDGAKYGVEINLISTWAERNFQDVVFSKDLRPHIKLRNAFKEKGKHFIIPQEDLTALCGAVIGWGDTLQEAIDVVTDISKEVKGYGLETCIASLKKADEEIEKMADIGLNLFD